VSAPVVHCPKGIATSQFWSGHPPLPGTADPEIRAYRSGDLNVSECSRRRDRTHQYVRAGGKPQPPSRRIDSARSLALRHRFGCSGSPASLRVAHSEHKPRRQSCGTEIPVSGGVSRMLRPAGAWISRSLRASAMFSSRSSGEAEPPQLWKWICSGDQLLVSASSRTATIIGRN